MSWWHFVPWHFVRDQGSLQLSQTHSWILVEKLGPWTGEGRIKRERRKRKGEEEEEMKGWDGFTSRFIVLK